MYKAVTLAGGIREPLLTCSSLYEKTVEQISLELLNEFGGTLFVRDRAQFVCLYGEIHVTHEFWRVDFRPYRRLNHAVSHL